jgi:hypothetical protein
VAKKPLVKHKPDAFKDVVVLQCHDEEGRQMYPRIAALFYPVYDGTVMTWMDGQIKIRVYSSLLKVTLCCPQEGKQVVATGDSLITCLDALEAMLGASPIPWEDDWETRKEGIDRLKRRE